MPHSQFNVRFSSRRDITAVEACSSRSFARHSHDEFGVGIITKGAQRSWSGRGMVEAGQGDLITVNPGEVHDGMPIGEERAWSMLYFSPELVGSIVADITEGKNAIRELHAPVVRDARARDRFLALSADPSDESLFLLFAALLGDARAEPPAAPGRLRRVRERIDDDPSATHPLEELAALAGISRFQVIRRFERLTGLTPHAYIVQRRLDLARRFIRGGSGLADAAAAAGFNDQSHLHRAFTARYGMTPGNYALACNFVQYPAPPRG
jgi:AraC-like DNA-binding protein